ncbi:MAG TPA: permease-like cell division protein FtsX [Firmicutes bacterium]|nr:permease-like cell division protein FtsX [Bacillota bacterium]
MKMHNAKYLIREGFHNLWTNRTMTLASVAVLISCLLLTGAAMLFSQNMGTAMKKLEGSNSITVYLDEDMPVLEAVQVGETLRSIENVKDCSYVSKDEALESMMELLGDDGTVLQGLSGDDNFLPDSYDISMKDLTKYDETIKEIKAVDGVSQITDYSDVADKLTRIDNLVATAGMWIVLLLGIVSLFIIANTIRVTMFSRRMEISIMKSVGATNWFVRLPFVVEGVMIGLIAGILASGLLFLMYHLMAGVITGILSFFTPVGLSQLVVPYTLGFVLAGMAFGALGSMISIGRFLNREGENSIEA